MPRLIVFSGLPCTGKTTLCRALAEQTRALYLRVDDIEEALKHSTLAITPAEDAGYRVAQAVAGTNLQLGRSVIIDAVNPVAMTRAWWADTAKRFNATLFTVTLVCSDLAEHRRRVTNRAGTPTWDAVVARQFQPHADATLSLDTSRLTRDQCVLRLMKGLRDQDRKLVKGI